MTGDDFIALAGKLAVSSPSPAARRTAVSRAYYGAFHLAAEMLQYCGVTLPEKSHNLDRYLQECGHRPAVQAGLLLGDLHEWRVRADYRLSNADVEQPAVALACVEDAREIQSLLNECRSPSGAESVRSGIESYLRKLRP